MPRYFGDSMELDMETEGGTTITLGSLQGVSIVAENNEILYYDADDVRITDRKHTEHAVPVTADFGSFDTELLQEWAGGSGASSTETGTGSDPQLFKLTGSVTQSGSSTKLQCEVIDVSFPNMPLFEATRNEFLEKNIEGTGAYAVITEV